MNFHLSLSQDAALDDRLLVSVELPFGLLVVKVIGSFTVCLRLSFKRHQ